MLGAEIVSYLHLFLGLGFRDLGPGSQDPGPAVMAVALPVAVTVPAVMAVFMAVVGPWPCQNHIKMTPCNSACLGTSAEKGVHVHISKKSDAVSIIQ